MRKAVALAVVGLLLAPFADRSRAQTVTWRPVVMAVHGMVASGHPLASEAGLRILKAGGNAVDAAVATWAVQTQVEAGSTSLGGDWLMMVYLAKTGEVKFINGSGFAPQAATIDFYKSKGGIPSEGPLTISVPGAVGGATYAVQKYGTQPLNDVLAPAIEIAEQGFPITVGLGRSLASSKEKLQKYPSTTKIWFKDGKPLEMGDILVNKDLGRTLRAIGARGADPFYRGAVAKNTAAFLKANGGIITEADLASYQPYEDAPVHVNFRGTEVYECPPNSQGFVMLEALNILEGYDLKAMGHNSAPYLHVVTEALKLSFADRNKYVGDPKFVPNIPMKALLSKQYAASRRAAIDPQRAIVGEPAPGDPFKFQTSTAGIAYGLPQRTPTVAAEFDPDKILNLTTYLAVVDKDHNMVSVTSSLLSGFGSGLVVDGGGFFLNDRMRYFYLDPTDVNSLQPGKRVRQTINPALAPRRQAVDHVRHAWRRHTTADAAPVLPQRRRVRDERAAGARAAVGHQQQLPRLLLSARGAGQTAHAENAGRERAERSRLQRTSARSEGRERCRVGEGHHDPPEVGRAHGRRQSDGR